MLKSIQQFHFTFKILWNYCCAYTRKLLTFVDFEISTCCRLCIQKLFTINFSPILSKNNFASLLSIFYYFCLSSYIGSFQKNTHNDKASTYVVYTAFKGISFTLGLIYNFLKSFWGTIYLKTSIQMNIMPYQIISLLIYEYIEVYY